MTTLKDQRNQKLCTDYDLEQGERRKMLAVTSLRVKDTEKAYGHVSTNKEEPEPTLPAEGEGETECITMNSPTVVVHSGRELPVHTVTVDAYGTD